VPTRLTLATLRTKDLGVELLAQLFGLDKENDLATFDLEHLHVRGVIAVRTGELAVELLPGLLLHAVGARHVSRFVVILFRHQIDDRLRRAIGFDGGDTARRELQRRRANEDGGADADGKCSDHAAEWC
jgi:hypothetical protein